MDWLAAELAALDKTDKLTAASAGEFLKRELRGKVITAKVVAR